MLLQSLHAQYNWNILAEYQNMKRLSKSEEREINVSQNLCGRSTTLIKKCWEKLRFKSDTRETNLNQVLGRKNSSSLNQKNYYYKNVTSQKSDRLLWNCWKKKRKMGIHKTKIWDNRYSKFTKEIKWLSTKMCNRKIC